ncbi:hypothetical protein [Clostridium sp.]|uniref:hypothetical protein n=1 Tax=Clostridium sp. TaxID=1506 RepID=UPI002FC7614D
MDHITIVNLELQFPHMIGTLENGEKRRVDVKDVVERFKSNQYAYPHMQQLLNENFFNKGKLRGCWCVCWDDMTDLDTFIFENAEVVKEKELD